MSDALLTVDRASVEFRTRRPGSRLVAHRALSDVSVAIAAGECLGVVGASGAGKTTLGRCIAGVQAPTAGEIRYGGARLDTTGDPSQRRAIQMVFQDPYSSLNPRLRVGDVLVELLRAHRLAPDRASARDGAARLLERVELPADALERRPAAFSAGERQRIAIARALAPRPALLVADEPVSALDVSVQAAVLALLRRLQRELGLAVVLISHDLGVVRRVCDRVAVMHAGRVVEQGPVGAVLEAPRAAVTRELLAAVPVLPPLETPPAIACAFPAGDRSPTLRSPA